MIDVQSMEEELGTKRKRCVTMDGETGRDDAKEINHQALRV